MKQYAVRMYPDLQKRTTREARRWKESFSEFARKAIEERIDTLSRWQPDPASNGSPAAGGGGGDADETVSA